MFNASAVIFDFVERLYEVEDAELLFMALEKAAKDLGFEYISYTLIPGVVLSAVTDYVPVFQLSEGYDVDLIEYHLRDIVSAGLGSTVNSSTSTTDMSVKEWWEACNNTELEDGLMLTASRYKHGISNGITIPTYNDGYNVASMSVYSSSRSDDLWTEFNKRIDCLKKIAIIYSDRVIGLSSTKELFYAPFFNELSSTERAVLLKMSKGESVQNIAHELEREYKYIANKILPGIRKKMGDVSRDRMMYFVGKMFINSTSD